jgi:hypothetical protein
MEVRELIDTFAERVARRVVEMTKEETEKERMEFLTPEAMAERMRVTVKTLANLRANGGGPKYVKVGRKVRYPVERDKPSGVE